MSQDSKWTAQQIPDQRGKVAVVTGANSGIGYETARALAQKGATVVLACRSAEKGEAAMEKLTAESPAMDLTLELLDLADLSSVRSFAERIRGRFEQLHLLCNNAGIMMVPFGRTTDGFELQFGTNHLGHFALTGLLLDRLLATDGSRVVNVASLAHRWGRLSVERLDHLHDKERYNSTITYGNTKMANLLFTHELQRRFDAAGQRTIAVAAHPGWTDTNLQAHTSFNIFNPLLAQSSEMGALPTLYAATAEDVQGSDYLGPRGIFELRGHPKKVKCRPAVQDQELAAALWTHSEDKTGISFDIIETVRS